MRDIEKIIIDHNINSLFTLDDLRPYFPSDNSLYSYLKRAVQQEKIVRVKKNLYFIHMRSREREYFFYPEGFIPLIDETAYLSDSWVLAWYYNWILETVTNLFATSQKKSNTIRYYNRGIYIKKIEQKDFTKGTFFRDLSGEKYLCRVAKPLKAVCDHIIRYKYDKDHFNRGILHWFEYSERTELDDLEELKDEDFSELLGNYPKYPIVDWFLDKLNSELEEYKRTRETPWRTDKFY